MSDGWPRPFGEKYPWGDTIPWPPEADLVTETDVLDEEVEQLQAWVRCENCDYGDVAERMTRDHNGAWLCWPCAKGEGEH